MTTARETPEISKPSIFDVIVSPAIHYESAAEHTNDIHEKTLLPWNGSCIVSMENFLENGSRKKVVLREGFPATPEASGNRLVETICGAIPCDMLEASW